MSEEVSVSVSMCGFKVYLMKSPLSPKAIALAGLAFAFTFERTGACGGVGTHSASGQPGVAPRGVGTLICDLKYKGSAWPRTVR